MRIILSRKGFDSSWGGYSCPILPDGTLLILPIPIAPNGPFAGADQLTYADLRVPGNGYRSFADVLGLHGIRTVTTGRERHQRERHQLEAVHCHLDPDLIQEVAERPAPWRAAFGQSDAAESHLRNQRVERGDLFLFFGLFRRSDGWQFIDARKHVLFGYLQIGEILRTDEPAFQQAEWPHPHFEPAYVWAGQNLRKNAVYAAREELVIAGRPRGVPGYGVFRYDDALVLTRPGVGSHTEWRLPGFFQHVAVSYHGGYYGWRDGYFQSAHTGQEFVFTANDAAIGWFVEELLPHRRP